MLAVFCVKSQNDNSEATVTIIGNPVENENLGNLPVNNFQTNQPPPPEQQQYAPKQENIEPTIENGFHMRYQIENPASVERVSNAGTSSSSSYSSSGGAKSRRHVISMTQRSFNFKKKFKNLMPKRKKKYHPTLCEKFR
jgi:hypothetical protein